MSRGSQGIPLLSPSTAEDPKTDVAAFRDIAEGRPELRTGMAQGSRAHRTPNALLTLSEGEGGEGCPTLLGNSSMFLFNPGNLPCLGIQPGSSLLVHQWDRLPGKAPGQLEPKNEDLPEVWSFSGENEPRRRNGIIAVGSGEILSGAETGEGSK